MPSTDIGERKSGCPHIYRIELNMILEKSLGCIEIPRAVYPQDQNIIKWIICPLRVVSIKS